MKGQFLGLLCYKFLCPFPSFRGISYTAGVWGGVEVGLNRNNRNQELSRLLHYEKTINEGVKTQNWPSLHKYCCKADHRTPPE